MVKAKDLRNQAWTALKGNWGTMALCALIYELILGACAGLAFFFIGGVALLVLSGPLALGFAILGLRVIRGGAYVKVENLFDGFKNFGKAFLLHLINSIFIALWTLLLIVPGIIKTLSYSMSAYILADNPDMDPNEARKQSMAMMKGHKWRLFCLHFSFIGWLLLCILTFGILTFWIMPYEQSAVAAFYQDLLARNGAANPVAPAALPEAAEEPAPETAENSVENSGDAE